MSEFDINGVPLYDFCKINKGKYKACDRYIAWCEAKYYIDKFKGYKDDDLFECFDSIYDDLIDDLSVLADKVDGK